MKKNSYSYDELINCGEGKLFGPGNAKLPLPPMLIAGAQPQASRNVSRPSPNPFLPSY